MPLLIGHPSTRLILYRAPVTRKVTTATAPKTESQNISLPLPPPPPTALNQSTAVILENFA